MSVRPENHSAVAGLSRAWYGAPFDAFRNAQPVSILGELATNSNFTLVTEQKDAWLAQIAFLQANLSSITGSLFLEFTIPRMGRRIDAVLVSGGTVFVIEFKVGEKAFDRAALHVSTTTANPYSVDDTHPQEYNVLCETGNGPQQNPLQMKPPPAEYTLIDLFAGAGGFTLGFKECGFTPILAVEKERLRSHL
jgi:hypothetical protein